MFVEWEKRNKLKSEAIKDIYMVLSRFTQLHDIGQSIWYDNLARSLLENGELAAMIQAGEIQGVTSNPTIFNQAIANTRDYDAAIKTMSLAGLSAREIYERLTIEDIQNACDLFTNVYKSSQGKDGYVSLEVNPNLAYDTDVTVAEAFRLWETVGRANLMIKVPATLAGLLAVRKLIAAGVNVNVTLIFSITRYRQVMDAYLLGLEDLLVAGKPLNRITSVASFFVSRMDTKVDQMLEKLAEDHPTEADAIRSLQGKAAVANARIAYREFEKVFNGTRFLTLQKYGADIQRPLWASTGVKNPAYPDTKYFDELVGPNSINTLPPKTLVVIKDHGRVNMVIRDDLDLADKTFSTLEAYGISMEEVTRQLEKEGVDAFREAYVSLLQTLTIRRMESWLPLGNLADPVAHRISNLDFTSTISRIFKHDPSLWISDPTGQAEIRQRLGWLRLPEAGKNLISEIMSFVKEIRQTDITNVLLLGMGGSSLAPEVMQMIFNQLGGKSQLHLSILDSTHPAQVLAAMQRSPVRNTLFIVASKSGTTTEVQALLAYFWARARNSLGDQAGQQFIAITDPGTPLEALAQERGFRKIFLGDPQVGGRFSALSIFGLLPAALIGINLDELLQHAEQMMKLCAREKPAQSNPGLVLGAVLGEAVVSGCDKLTLVADRPLDSLGSWLEQLIAESSGKSGMGIIPVDGEPVTDIRLYGKDRLFVYLRTNGEYDDFTSRLTTHHHPVITLPLSDVHDLGTEFYRWEFAIAVACAVMKVNPFDQPNVQDNKNRTKVKISELHQKGKLVEPLPSWQVDGICGYGNLPEAVPKDSLNLRDYMNLFFSQVKAGDYIALNVYLPRNRQNIRRFARLRLKILQKTGAATTLGFGPRFLHSTGQLHKGGADNGVFLLVTADPTMDRLIPGEGLTFGQLIKAQALGDFEALLARGRRVLRINLHHVERLKDLMNAVG
jgi:transaldolase/glucose-6-phosphate isomerase